MGNGASSASGKRTQSVVIGTADRFSAEELKKIVPQLKNQLSTREAEIAKLNNELVEANRELNSVKQELHQLKCVVEDKLHRNSSADNLRPDNASLPTDSQTTEQVNEDSKELLAVEQIGMASTRNKRFAVSAESSRQSGEVMTDLKRHPKDTRAKELIACAIEKNKFLKHLEKPQVREIVDCMYLESYSKNTYVIKESESGSAVYVLGEGILEVSKNNEVLGQPMHAGTLFGELAILYNCTRTASVRVMETASIWTLERSVFQQIMQRTGMMRREADLAFLKSVPLLKNLSSPYMYKIVDVLEQDFYYTDQHIVREGEEGDTFFIIKSGTVKVFQQVTGEIAPREIRSLGQGDYFGEKALLSNGDIRTASIVAQKPGVQCLVIDRSTFLSVIGSLSLLKEKDYGDEERGALTATNQSIHRTSSKLSEGFGIMTSSSKRQVVPEFMDCTLDDFKLLATLGMGGFGRVELVQDKRSPDKTYALKCLGKAFIVETKQQEHTFNEKEILLSLDNPFVVKLHQTFRDRKYVYLLMEVCLGGELWTILRDRDFFSEPTARFFTACVVEALAHLHSKGIIYRDLKPENLLVDQRGYAKLVDFGFAKKIGNGKKTWTFCGTPEYVPPEIILNKGHDLSADYWSLGILIFELMTGNPPFTSNDAMTTYTIILRGIGTLEFPSRITKTAQHIIRKLCKDAPSERLGSSKDGSNAIRRHKWFQGFHWKGLSSRTLQAPLEPKIKNPTDSSNFDTFPDLKDIPPDETSDWDINF